MHRSLALLLSLLSACSGSEMVGYAVDAGSTPVPDAGDAGLAEDLGADAGLASTQDLGTTDLGLLDAGPALDAGPPPDMGPPANVASDPRSGTWLSTQGPSGARVRLLGAGQGKLFAAVTNADRTETLMRSDADGRVWVPVTVNGTSRYEFDDVVGTPAGFVLMTRDGVFTSTNAGQSFSQVQSNTYNREIFARGDDIYLTGDYQMLKVSSDLGRTFTDIADLASRVTAGPDYLIYQISNTAELVRIPDGGGAPVELGLPGGIRVFFTDMLSTPEGLFGFSSRGLMLSRDRGTTWTTVSTTALYALVGHGGELLAVDGSGATYRYVPSTQTLQAFASSAVTSGARFHARFASIDGHLYLDGAYEEVFRYRPGTMGWQSVELGTGGYATLAEGSGALWAGVTSSVQLSRWDGVSWTQTAGPGRPQGIFSIRDRVWLAAWDGGLWKEVDGTASAISEGRLGVQNPTNSDRVSVVRQTPEGVVVGMLGGGLGAADGHGNSTNRPSGGGVFLADESVTTITDLSSALPTRYAHSWTAPAGVLDLAVRADGAWIAALLHGSITPAYLSSLYISTDAGRSWSQLGAVSGHRLSRVVTLGTDIFALDTTGEIYVGDASGSAFAADHFGLAPQILFTDLVAAPTGIILGTTDGVYRVDQGSRIAYRLGSALSGERVYRLFLGAGLSVAIPDQGVLTFQVP